MTEDTGIREPAPDTQSELASQAAELVRQRFPAAVLEHRIAPRPPAITVGADELREVLTILNRDLDEPADYLSDLTGVDESRLDDSSECVRVVYQLCNASSGCRLQIEAATGRPSVSSQRGGPVAGRGLARARSGRDARSRVRRPPPPGQIADDSRSRRIPAAKGLSRQGSHRRRGARTCQPSRAPDSSPSPASSTSSSTAPRSFATRHSGSRSSLTATTSRR